MSSSQAIGQAAGKVWSALGAANQRVAIANLAKVVGNDVTLAQQAVGWLARENKVAFEKNGRAVYVKLSAVEVAAHKKSCKKQSAGAGTQDHSAPVKGQVVELLWMRRVRRGGRGRAARVPSSAIGPSDVQRDGLSLLQPWLVNRRS